MSVRLVSDGRHARWKLVCLLFSGLANFVQAYVRHPREGGDPACSSGVVHGARKAGPPPSRGRREYFAAGGLAHRPLAQARTRRPCDRRVPV